jgi:hypothetical protein
MSALRLVRLTEESFPAFEALTAREGGGGCYCAFWHQKFSSLADWEAQCKSAPEKNRSSVFERVRAGFHVGVLAYRGSELAAWVSVGPVTDFYWTWRRVAQIGEKARAVAGITCITLAEPLRGQKLQSEVLAELRVYGRDAGWDYLEGYPFDPRAVERHGRELGFPGLAPGFAQAGFERVGPHWLSKEGYERSIYRVALEPDPSA